MGRKAKASKVELISRRILSLDDSSDKPLPEDIQPTSVMNSLPEVQTTAAGDTLLPYTSGFTKEKLESPAMMRSPTIQCTDKEVDPVNQESEPAIEENILISEDQNDDEPIINEDNKLTGKASDESGSSFMKDKSGVADVKYKSIYISCQKKIEALIEENKQLGKSLEFANGKIEVFEKQSNIYSKVFAVIASLSSVNKNLAARVVLGCPHDGRNFKKRRMSNVDTENLC